MLISVSRGKCCTYSMQLSHLKGTVKNMDKLKQWATLPAYGMYCVSLFYYFVESFREELWIWDRQSDWHLMSILHSKCKFYLKMSNIYSYLPKTISSLEERSHFFKYLSVLERLQLLFGSVTSLEVSWLTGEEFLGNKTRSLML